MVQFLYPSVLWALWLMAIPLIIHLINLHRHKVIYFSQTSFLKRVEKESRRTRKLNNLLLLLLRMLVIGFLVLAFSVPRMLDENKSVQGQSSSVVVFVDNSLSMQAENRNGNLLEQAKQYVIKRISTFPETTPVKIISHTGIISEKINPQLVQGVMNNITYSATTISVHSLLQLLSPVEGTTQPQIWIVSDMQENYWRSFFEMVDTSITIVPVQIDPDSPENVVIDTAWFDTPFRNAGIAQNLRVRITNRGTKFRSNIPVRLYLNDTLTSVQSIDLEQTETKNSSFTFSLGNVGWVRGRVEIDDYPIVFDNQYFFSYYVNPVRHVVLVGDEEYYAPLLKLYSVSGQISAHVVRHEYLNPGLIDSASCILVRNPGQLSSGIAEYLHQSVISGTSLVLLIDETENFEAEGRFLQSYSLPQPGRTVKTSAMVNEINLQHYIFNRAVQSIDKDTKMPNIEKLRRFQQFIPYSEILMATDLKEPVLVARPIGKGMVFMATTEMMKNREISKHPIFVPLFINVVQFAGSGVEPVFTLVSNQCFDVPVGDWSTNELPVLSLQPDGIQIIPRFQLNRQSLSLCLHNQVQRSGIWMLQAKQGNIANIALNYSRLESVQGYLGEEDQLRGLRNLSKTDIPFEVNTEEPIFALWQILVALALICFVCELVILRGVSRI